MHNIVNALSRIDSAAELNFLANVCLEIAGKNFDGGGTANLIFDGIIDITESYPIFIRECIKVYI